MRLMTLFVAGIMLAGCANFQSVEAIGSTHTTNTPTADHSVSYALRRLQTVYANYKGTPYRYGGMDKSGFDCSGFISVAYRDAFDRSMPRTTEKLASNGKPIRRDQLTVGDIIIFKTSVKQLHAGIYTGSGKFIHASTSKGVIQSSLENQYWQQRYIKARRYL